MTLLAPPRVNLDSFCRTLKILDKQSRVVPFRPNWAQQAILDQLWSRGPATPDQIREALLPAHRLKDSSVRTLLRRLEIRGYVSHRLEEVFELGYAGDTDESTQEWLKSMEFPLGGGINGLAAQEVRPIWTGDYLTDTRFEHTEELLARAGADVDHLRRRGEAVQHRLDGGARIPRPAAVVVLGNTVEAVTETAHGIARL